MRAPLLLVTFILSSLLAAAQDSAATPPLHVTHPMIYIEPLALLDGVDAQSYRAGIEIPLNGKWSVYGTGGGYFSQGYIVRAGIKRYFKQVGPALYSLSLEYVNNWHTQAVTDYYIKGDTATGGSPDYSRPLTYQVEKNINALTVLFARDRIWHRHWVFEYYTGLGVKFKKAGISIPASTQDQLYNFDNSFIDGISYVRGQYVEPDIRLGIKLGWLFRNR